MDREATALIIGAGVAGLSSALALSRAGLDVRVFEERVETAPERGALLLWSNGVRALRRLGLEERILELGSPVHVVEFRNAQGKLLTSLPVAALSQRHAAATLVIERKHLLEALAAALPAGALQMGMAFEWFTQDHRHVAARFLDSSRLRGDLLVGADGIRSRVRAQLRQREPLRRTGQIALVGIGKDCRALAKAGVAVATVGAGLRFWFCPLPAGRVYWYATVPASADLGESRVEMLARCRGLFERWHPPIAELIARTDSASLVRTSSADRAPVDRWGTGLVTLVGDAAQPCTPDLGQGACQALEGAVVLAKCLSREDDIERALRSYEQRRLARTARVAQLSWVTAMQSMSSSPLACAVRDLGVQAFLAPLAIHELDWLLA